ncbi:MAG: peptidylprolyl isomerase, partial [Desulfamplus sp.]|nr:peptidylprolyl isomerase [Desulfamplus sp.]
FKTAVKQESIDQGTKEKDGSMGWITEEKLPKEMWNYIASLEKGKVSEPFMYDDNWLLIELVGKKKSEKKDFESVKDSIRIQLVQKEYMKKLDAEFERLKKEFNVAN